jgi:hypothetical protein
VRHSGSVFASLMSFFAWTYVGDPAKDVRVEAHVVLGYIKPALNENFTLQGTPIVYPADK